MLPVIKLISCFLVHACFLIIMAGLYLIDGRMPSATWIQVLYYSFAASMLGLALTYFTSAVQVFFKDMAQIVGICLQFGMWLTPIMYDEEIFTSRASWLEWVLKFNPFYYIAAGYRDSMLLMLLGLKVFKSCGRIFPMYCKRPEMEDKKIRESKNSAISVKDVTKIYRLYDKAHRPVKRGDEHYP